ncbi:MAG TPA: LuxR C-terminal-related transcriptional regulator [Armatimonadota bacterium]|jgi:DNA-binding NarL/FixJ family response regulator
MMPAAGLDVFEMIADVEARIGALRFGDSYALYELLYEAASRLGSTSCFYICLYDAESDTLNFAYNRDGDALEEPCTVPLGDGPTSWVVRNLRPFFLSEATVEKQRAGFSFGDKSRFSSSAMHLPMRTIGEDGRRHLVGVMSVQSYEPDAYDPQEIELLQALADRGARILHDDAGHADCRRRIAALERESERRQSRAIRITNDFIEHLSSLAHQAHALVAMTPAELSDLRDAEIALDRSLHKVMTLAAEAPARLEQARPDSETQPGIEQLTALDLTKRELEIAVLLANGRSNASIAGSLYLSVDTVKFHCANIYRKLGVRNRTQAVQAATALIFGRGA